MRNRPKGALLINEMIVPIIDLRLSDGGLLITGEINGPVKAGSASVYTLTDDSGMGVASGDCNIRWPMLSLYDTLRFELTWKFEKHLPMHSPSKTTGVWSDRE